MNNKELEASFRKAKALGDDIREMESIDALAAYRQSQMKIRGLKRTRLHNQLIRCAAFLAIPLLLASLILGYLYFAESEEEIRYAEVISTMGTVVRYELPDHSVVWLNSGSKLRYPTVFQKDNRNVELTGEAYFQVEAEPERPFYVNTPNGLSVYVYGTQFNVRRYVDEEGIRATLVDGSVGFAKNGQKEDEYIKIEPGYQVRYEEGQEVVVQKVKVYNEIAWKNHQFSFERKPLDEIMKDFMRWYDVNITFEDESLHELYFSATLNRYGNIETLLRFFEAGYDIKFEINGKNIKVKRK